MRVIGLMSGTSFDAVDAAAADLVLDGEELVLTPLGMVSSPYPDDLREALAAALPPAATTLEEVCRLDTRIGQVFAELAARADTELCGGGAELVVSHGQTVFHWIEDGAVRGTLQLGQPAWIAERTGRWVVSDLRSRDVAAGGQGAPLVSMFDVLWLRGRPGTTAALNLGGIANITVAGPGREPVALDTGPANALLDAAVQHRSGGARRFDADGALAARGRVRTDLLELLLDDPYYARPAPKSTGKEHFHLPYLLSATGSLPEASTEDLLATLVALTARTVADAVRAAGAEEVVVAGGGTRNPVLLRALAEELGPVPLLDAGTLGVPPEAKEAYAFAVLGFLTASGLPSTVPSCTGASHSSVLGSLTPGRGPLPVAGPPDRAPTRLRIAG